jgi:TRAP-type C4-dicarboxylate transport system permease small subunit
MKRAKVQRFYSAIRKVDGALGMIAGSSMLIITAIICYGILARYVFRRPLIWGADICSYLLLVIAVFSGAYTMAVSAHINFTIVVECLEPKARRVIISIGSILGLIYCFFLLSETVQLALMAIKRNMHTHDQLGIPDIYLYLVILIGCFMLSVTFLITAIYDTFYPDKKIDDPVGQ